MTLTRRGGRLRRPLPLNHRYFTLATGALLAAIGIAGSLLAGSARSASGAGTVHGSTATASFGVAEDAGKYAEDGGLRVANDLAGIGLGVQRWTLLFDPAAPTAIGESAFLDRAVPVARAHGSQLILSLFQKGAAVPDATVFCAWAASVAARYPSIKKFIVGNEVNATRFWSPQHTDGDQDAGPRSYFGVLTACYDSLKHVAGDIQVIGMGLAPRSVDAKSTKPLDFIRAVGKIYRDSGRAAPIMDALAVHPYPNPNARPQPAPDDAGYQDRGFYGIPQLDRVKQAVYDAFVGTAQPTPLNGLRLVIDEVGYQTNTDGNSQYTGSETSPVVTDEQQATYHARIVSLYSCDPLISDILFFHLIDESQRNPDVSSGGWQSGLQRPNGEAKPALAAVKAAVAAGCATGPIGWTPALPSGATTAAAATTTAATTTAATTTSAADSGSSLADQLNRLFEQLPALATDGASDLVPTPASTATIERAAHAITDGFSFLWTGHDSVQLPPVFWQLPLRVREQVFVTALQIFLPDCGQGRVRPWTNGYYSQFSAMCSNTAEDGFTTFQKSIDYKVVGSGATLEICIRGASVVGGARGCVRRTISARTAGLRKAGVYVLGYGSSTVRAGGTLSGTMTRLAGGLAGSYQTVLLVQSARSPQRYALIKLRPVAVPVSALRPLAAPKATSKPAASTAAKTK